MISKLSRPFYALCKDHCATVYNCMSTYLYIYIYIYISISTLINFHVPSPPITYFPHLPSRISPIAARPKSKFKFDRYAHFFFSLGRSTDDKSSLEPVHSSPGSSFHLPLSAPSASASASASASPNPSASPPQPKPQASNRTSIQAIQAIQAPKASQVSQLYPSYIPAIPAISAWAEVIYLPDKPHLTTHYSLLTTHYYLTTSPPYVRP